MYINTQFYVLLFIHILLSILAGGVSSILPGDIVNRETSCEEQEMIEVDWTSPSCSLWQTPKHPRLVQNQNIPDQEGDTSYSLIINLNKFICVTLITLIYSKYYKDLSKLITYLYFSMRCYGEC